MNKTSGADRARANRPGRKIVTAAGLLLAMSATLPGLSQAQTFTVVDTLSTAPGKTFSIFGTGGLAITTEQFVGPRFTLTQRAVLTRVGAFVNNCATITSGVPQCPNALPFVVQIRRSVNGAPDPRLVVAAAPLSHDNNPLAVSFESASFDNIPLEAGTYFAVFAPQQAGDGGLLLSTAPGFVAGITAIGEVRPSGSVLNPANHAAVQVIARAVP
jgi:hypothetical protein